MGMAVSTKTLLPKTGSTSGLTHGLYFGDLWTSEPTICSDIELHTFKIWIVCFQLIMIAKVPKVS